MFSIKKLISRIRKKNQTIYIIGGGEVHPTMKDYFKWVKKLKINNHITKDWKNWLKNRLEWNGYKVIRITMPDKTNAYYEAWKLMYEKYPVSKNDIVIGHSLGAIFLYKYYYRKPKRKVPQIHLVAPGSIKRGDWSINPYKSNYSLWLSNDDQICPPSDIKQHIKLNKGFQFWFDDKGHFLQPTFPEMFDEIND